MLNIAVIFGQSMPDSFAETILKKNHTLLFNLLKTEQILRG
jgi:hypothetical protein